MLANDARRVTAKEHLLPRPRTYLFRPCQRRSTLACRTPARSARPRPELDFAGRVRLAASVAAELRADVSVAANVESVRTYFGRPERSGSGTRSSTCSSQSSFSPLASTLRRSQDSPGIPRSASSPRGPRSCSRRTARPTSAASPVNRRVNDARPTPGSLAHRYVRPGHRCRRGWTA